jgi:hypothetical protein
MALTRAQILHVGVGNSKLAQRLASRFRSINGLTVHHNEKPMPRPWRSPIIPCMCSISTVGYDFIIDNNLASFACCKKHFFVMLKNYLAV